MDWIAVAIGAAVGTAAGLFFGWLTQRLLVRGSVLDEQPALGKCRGCGRAVFKQFKRCVSCNFSQGKLTPPQGGSSSAPPSHTWGEQ